MADDGSSRAIQPGGKLNGVNIRNPGPKSNRDNTLADGLGSSARGSVPEFIERHYSVAEIAAFWNLSEDFVRRIFDKELGVLVFEDARPSRRKRRYRTLRVPQHVLDRVHRRISQV